MDIDIDIYQCAPSSPFSICMHSASSKTMRVISSLSSSPEGITLGVDDIEDDDSIDSFSLSSKAISTRGTYVDEDEKVDFQISNLTSLPSATASFEIVTLSLSSSISCSLCVTRRRSCSKDFESISIFSFLFSPLEMVVAN